MKKYFLLVTMMVGFGVFLGSAGVSHAYWTMDVNNFKDLNGTKVTKVEFFVTEIGGGDTAYDGTGLTIGKGPWASGQMINSSYAVATGSKVNLSQLDFDLNLKGSKTFYVDLLLYDGNQCKSAVRVLVSNGIWKMTNQNTTVLDVNSLPQYNRTASTVPVPPTVVLLGAGLVGMGILRKRSKKSI